MYVCVCMYLSAALKSIECIDSLDLSMRSSREFGTEWNGALHLQRSVDLALLGLGGK